MGGGGEEGEEEERRGRGERGRRRGRRKSEEERGHSRQKEEHMSIGGFRETRVFAEYKFSMAPPCVGVGDGVIADTAGIPFCA